MSRRRGWIAAVLALLAGAASAGDGLVNASFEEPGDVPAGWTFRVGAKSGEGPESAVVIDRTVARDGKASLRFSGDAATGTWRMVQQEIACREGDRLTLRVAAKCKELRLEGRQLRNANSIVVFETASGWQRQSILGSPVLAGDREWVDLTIDTIVPAAAQRAAVGFFSSMTGTVWFDDVRVETGPATADDAAGRARAFDALAGHLARTYPFFGIAGRPEAEALFARHRKPCIDAKDAPGFLDAMHAMLAELDDVHVNVETAQRRLPTAKARNTPPNWNVAAIRAALTETTVNEKNLLAGRIGKGADAIGYVLVGTFQTDEAGIGAALKALDGLADTKALVLDVRPNVGGDENLASRIAARFTEKDVVYARCAWRDPTLPGTAGFGPPIDRVLKPAPKFDARKVVLLQGPYCVSSTEGFVQMMKALPNVTTMGLPTRGASANPAAFEVVPGVKVWTSRWRSLTLDGECIEGKGVAPEVLVEGSHAKSDPTLERAIAELRR